VRDGVNIARAGLPAIALVTSEFWPQGNFVARSVGMPDVPRLQLPHPVAGSGTANMAAVAKDICDAIVAAFAGAAK